MNNEEEKKCPLCAEEMDWTDQQLNPCKCGYEVCVWCWHHIMDMAEKDATEGRCPACRTPYNKDRIVGLEANFERVAANSSNRKQKLSKAKPKPNEGRKDLSNVRVIQRKMAYIIGLPLDLADEELLQRKDYFGQYGKVTKVSLSRTVGGAVQQFINDTCSVYITYSKEDEAVACIQSVHGYVLDGRPLRASFGTAKYCHAWLRNTPCNNPACLYLHAVGAEEDSFGKDEVAAVHTRNRVQEIAGGTRYLHRYSGSTLPPPVIDQLNTHSDYSEEPVCNNDLEVAYPALASDGSKEDGPVRLLKNTATFVDVVGRLNSLELADSNRDDAGSITKEQSSAIIDSITFDDKRSKDSSGSSHTASFDPSYPASTPSDYSWWHSELHNQIGADHNIVHSSVTNDGYNEKFQNSAKSDRIYRCSNSFSNDEIVERLRRVDHDGNSADVESSIISDILSMDLDGSDNSMSFPQSISRFSSRIQNNDQSRFSFAIEHEFSGQQVDPGSSSSNVGQELTSSVLLDSSENKDYFYVSQRQASRAQNLTPPGFSMPSKTPPGFSACMRTEQVVSSSSGNYFRAELNNRYGSSSLGNLNISPQYALGTAIHHHQEPYFSPATTQNHHHHHHQFPSSQGSHTSGLMGLHHQSYKSSSLTQQPNFAGGYQQRHNHLQEEDQPHDPRSEAERYGFDSFLFQTPTSGDVYTRVFGM